MSNHSASVATAGQAKHSLTILEQQGLTAADYAKLHDGYLAALAQAAKAGTLPELKTFRAMLKLTAVMPESFRLTVDYGQTLEQMIAAGNYDWKNDDLTAKRFPIKGDGIVEFEVCLFHFDRMIESKDAIKAIEAADSTNPWAPAKTEHLLSFGIAFPEEQRKYPVIGLGSVARVGGYRNVPGLWEYGSERDLRLYWFEGEWGGLCRFLAVRQVSAA
ncbi:MAG: hypothetical protein JWM39_52 [Parcubacteria group bacterium]|nr:hypothetical protein [Parcubacteria group bacterium]